ncbi:optic atrophy 3 protein-domain-containing protein [Aspergillus bertholletiae]|uniref:Optic atrophy 3 protein-domain-containing protein n=1 Tax=Aspergillus bertholletiae TaxID=1226010 RepID=A0A5N7BK37_9EURO|nr:optic atrophy 3 protein-domain-containing protein [Aspergillus bertholletiae]
MSLTLKLSSLAIRTLSKPIATHIRAQAREHERFRKVCISMAQALHRFDMRLRLGAVRDNAASQKQAAAEAALRKLKPTSPTVKTEAEAKAEEDAIAKAKAAAEDAAKPAPKPHIRPLSESKAIESGATFISETFLFLVAGGLIVFESWRSRRKETTRREDVESRLVELEKSEKAAREALLAMEKELLAQKAKHGELSKSSHRILPRNIWDVEKQEETEQVEEQGWWSWITSYLPVSQTPEQQAESVIRESKKTTPQAPTPVGDIVPAQNPASPDHSSGPKKA